jgi:predicted DNA-binding transcriptional regulator YafY
MKPESKKFLDKTKKLHRLISLLRMLDNRERCILQALAEKFDTTTRTILRDISDLNSSGFAILFDKEAGTYTFVDSDFTLRDLDLSKNELMALLLGKQIAHSLGKPFENAFQSLLKKAHKDTGTKTRGRMKGLEQKPQFFIDIDEAKEFENIERQYHAVTDALNEKQEIEICYKDMRSQRETQRSLAPYGMILWDGLWYAIGHCSLRRGIRIFALDCIKEFRITDRPYLIPDNFDINEYCKAGWHIMRYGSPVEVVLKFSERYARWIKRRKWHPTQVIEENKDGSILFKVIVEGTRDLKWWIYHWIPYVEILSPPELKKEMIEEMRETLKVYGKNA